MDTTRIDPTRNARFWVWGPDGWVKLTLKPGQSLTHKSGGPHEEGWSYTDITWQHQGTYLATDQVTNSRDCDGRLDRYWEATATKLEPYYDHHDPKTNEYQQSGTLVGDRPVWEEESASQRDHTAEAMGY